MDRTREKVTEKAELIEKTNGAQSFAIIITALSLVVGPISGAAFKGFELVKGVLVQKSYDFVVMFIVMFSGLFLAACAFAVAGIIERQNKIIELLKN